MPKIQVNLGTTDEVNLFEENVNPGVTGTLGVSNGGTGASNFTSGEALIGNGSGAIATRKIIDNTSATVLTATNDLITANTLCNFVGNTQINTVGTVSVGQWQAMIISTQYGGTGAALSKSPEAIVNLGSSNKGVLFLPSPSIGVSGVLRVDNGGTGASDPEDALTNLGITYGKNDPESITNPRVGQIYFKIIS
jgi:hypothetical protein